MAEINNNNNNFNSTVNSLFNGMSAFLTSKTVMGEPQVIGDTTIIPLMDVNFGVGAGANSPARGGNTAGGGMGGKMSPSAVIVIQGDFVRILPIGETNKLQSVMDMIPGVVEKVQKFLSGKGKSEEEKAVDEAIDNLGEKNI
ncbi:MAG: sporulation protein [Eubacterium sp.]|nr:sporulation protein [Eubacterium sp.]